MTAERIAVRMQWLAYQASRPVGLGIIHFATDKTEDDIAKIVERVDHDESRTAWYSDYIFGRMVKCAVCFKDGQFHPSASNLPRHDYQSWAVKYPTYLALYDAAVESLEE